MNFLKISKNLLNYNKKIIIVSSGAIAMGCKKLNLSKKNLKLDKSQADCIYWSNRINEFIYRKFY